MVKGAKCNTDSNIYFTAARVRNIIGKGANAVPTQIYISLLLLFLTLLAKVRNAVPAQAQVSPPLQFVPGNNSGCNVS
jgi:hypothetical protein